MNRTKLLTATILTLACAAATFAIDYGLELSNKGGIQNRGTFDWSTDHKETLWFTLPFDTSNTNSLALEGSAYAAKKPGSTGFTFYADLDLLRISLVPVSQKGLRLSADLGRINTSDVTGFVLGQKIDGLEFHSSLPFGNIDFMAGYTGLLNARKGFNLMTKDDALDYDTSSVYSLGASRAVGKFSFQIPQFIGSTDVVLEGVGQYDLRNIVRSSYMQLLNTAYGTVSFNGPLLNNLYYSLSGTYQTGTLKEAKESSENALLASFRLDMFPVDGNHLFAQFVYTPKRSSFFSDFLPITYQSAGSMYPYGYGNLMKASAGWYFNPAKSVNFDIGGNVFFNSSEVKAGAGLYNSTEVSGGATFKLTNDLRFRLDSLFYFPNSAAMEYQGGVKMILEL
jgi:hypothetical protein